MQIVAIPQNSFVKEYLYWYNHLLGALNLGTMPLLIGVGFAICAKGVTRVTVGFRGLFYFHYAAFSSLFLIL